MGIGYNPFSLNGKTILVTGASSGIGQETAVQCSKLGAKVILTARDEVRLNVTKSQMEDGEHEIVVADLTHQDQIEKLADFVDDLDGVVLCAGKGMISPFLFSAKEKFDSVFQINFFAPVELLRQLVKMKKLKKESSVVFVSSVGGVFSFNVGIGVYGVSKAAINSMMKFCAKELATKKIRVNSVNPGRVETKLIHSGILSEEQQQLDMEKYPLKRYGKPQDIAFGIIYLLSDASSWITGHSLVIDGGLTI